MTSLTLFKGRKGADGEDGIDGLSPSDVDSTLLDSPMLSAIHDNVLSKNAFVTFERDSINAYTDRYGINRLTDSETYTNYIEYSEDFSQWLDPTNKWSIVGTTSDPIGGNSATVINLDVDTDNLAGAAPIIQRNESGWPVEGYIVVSLWIKRVSGDVSDIDLTFGTSKYSLNGVSDEYQRKFVKVRSSSGGFLLGVNPRGKAGARVAVFGVQINNSKLEDYIKKNGIPVTVTNESPVKIINNTTGYYLEGEEVNLCRNTQDLQSWSVQDGAIGQYFGYDAFGFPNSKTRVVFSSLPNVILSTDTEALVEGDKYNVSFYAFNEGGSINSITVSLGGGDGVVTAQPSVVGFERISVDAVAGAENNISINVLSEPLNGKLNIGAFQIASGLSSYIESESTGGAREMDLIQTAYKYNAPAPNLPWSFVFTKHQNSIDERVKTVFSNGQFGVDEFSLTMQSRLLILNMGGNITSYDMFDVESCVITYDGSIVNFYDEQRLVFSANSATTSFISDYMYIGSNGVDNSFYGGLSNILFYNSDLSPSDIAYLMGA